MLIDFTVSNFRSIKDPVTLSAIATPSRSTEGHQGVERRRGIKSDNEISPAIPVENRGFELVPVLGIFGANASGKSNVLLALDYLLAAMGGNFMHARNLRELTSFRFDSETLELPTSFEIRLALEGSLYRYALSLTRSEIISETLSYVPKSSKRRSEKLLFDRQWNKATSTSDWKNSDDFSGPHLQLQEKFRSDRPFLAFVLDSLDVSVVSPIGNWLVARWPGVHLGSEEFDEGVAIAYTHENDEDLRRITQLIRRFDTGISDIEVKSTERDGGGDLDIYSVHHTAIGPVKLPFSEESTGTRRLFSLAFQILLALDFGKLRVIDELGSNIHPHITREIVRLFQSPTTNPKHAQLIFTSHDNTLQQRNLLRRDQIWFTQKKTDGGTDLYPLSDFRPRNDLAIDKSYMDGRFGAVPVLPDTDDLLDTSKAGMDEKVVV